MRRLKDGSYKARLDLYKMWYVVDFAEEDDNFGGITRYDNEFKSNTVFITFYDRSQGIVAHECVHAAMYTLERVGLPVDFKHDEALAYLVGWLVEQVNKALEKENGQKV